MKFLLSTQLFFIVSLSSAGTARDCLMCQWPSVPEMAKEGPDNACEDLFGAACLKPNGERKYSRVEEDILQPEAKSMIEGARAEALKAMGYNSVDNAVTGELRRAGIELEPATSNTNTNSNPPGDSFSVNGRNFTLAKKCFDDFYAMQRQLPKGDSEDILAQRVQAYLEYEKKKKESLAKIYALDIPNYMSKVDRECEYFKQNNDKFPLANNSSTVAFCSQILQIQREAVDLFRQKGSAQYATLAEQFVKKYTIPMFEDVPPKPNENISAYLRRKEAKLLTPNCGDVYAAMSLGTSAVLGDLNEKLMRSQPAVDHILRTAYSPERQRTLETMTASVRAHAQTLARNYGPNSTTQEKMASDFVNLEVWWPRSFSNDDYIKDPQTGLMVLNPDKLDMTEEGIFLDPTMGHFKSFNAYNSPEVHIEEVRVANQVNMQPYMLQLMQKNPFHVYAILAHEFGHNFDPNRVQMAGYQGMGAQYSNLMACYKDSRSINMQRGQEGEVFSDYVAAEMIASEVNKVPPAMRRRTVMNALSGFCMMESLSGNDIQFGEHPITMLRIAGVMGGNPSLRKMLGCSADSSKYKTCGMPTSILDMNSQSPVNPSHSEEREYEGVEM